MSIPFETTQSIIDAIESVLGNVLQSQGDIAESFQLENFVKQVQAIVPDAPSEVIVAYLQLYLTPMGEGEDDYYMGEDFGEGSDMYDSNFQFALDGGE